MSYATTKPQFITKIDRAARGRFAGRLRRNRAADDCTPAVCIEVPMLFTFGSIYSTSCLVYVE